MYCIEALNVMASFTSNAAIAARLKEEIGLDRNSLEYGGGKYREENDYRLIRSAAGGGGGGGHLGGGQVAFSAADYSAHPPSRLRDDFRSSSTPSDMVGGGGGKDHDFSGALRPPPIPFSSSGVGSGSYPQHFWNYGGGGKR